MNYRQLRQNNMARIHGNQMDRRPRFPSIQDFCEMLRRHTQWAFRAARKEMDNEQMQAFVEATEREQDLFAVAWDGGDEYMQVLANYMNVAKSNMIPKPTSVELAAKRMIAEWDDDLKEFCDRVERHDWFADFADMASVGQRAAERYLELEKIATEKGGLYELILSQKTKQIRDHIRSGKAWKED